MHIYFIIHTLFLIFVQYKRIWLICFELPFCLFLLLLFFREDLWLKKHSHWNSGIRKMFEVSLHTQKSLSTLGRGGGVKLEILHICHYHHRFYHFFKLNFSYNILRSKYLGINNIGVNGKIIFKCFSIHFLFFKFSISCP